jgi:HD superfamily phosphohydrolase
MNEYIFEVAFQFHRLGKYYGNTSDTHFSDIYEETIKLINKTFYSMNPKEKAENLVLKYLKIENNTKEWFNKKIAKQCALIAVDLIYEGNFKLPFGAYLDEFEDKENYYSYWEEVKKEIENL